MNYKGTDAAAHNTGSICKHETNKIIKYDKNCRMCRTAELSPKMSQLRLERKIREMGIFHFPKFRITCIIRNMYNLKEGCLLSFCQIFGSFCGCFSVRTRTLLRRWTHYQYVQAFDLCRCSIVSFPLVMRCSFHRQRFCAKVCTDGFVINACHSLAAPLLPKCSILIVRHKHCSANTAGQSTSSSSVKLRSGRTCV